MIMLLNASKKIKGISLENTNRGPKDHDGNAESDSGILQDYED